MPKLITFSIGENGGERFWADQVTFWRTLFIHICVTDLKSKLVSLGIWQQFMSQQQHTLRKNINITSLPDSRSN
jgi:hypothetical protein